MTKTLEVAVFQSEGPSALSKIPNKICTYVIHVPIGMELFCEFITKKKIGKDLFKYFNVTFAASMSRLTNAPKSSSAYDLI